MVFGELTWQHSTMTNQRKMQRIQQREGGIIWHTQGSGKSLTMVWLAKWIREHVTDARVLIITDRNELDEQIEKVFKGVDEDIYRTQSGAERLHQYGIYRRMLAEFFNELEEMAMYKVEEFERQVKERFIHEPGQMWLLIVVERVGRHEVVVKNNKDLVLDVLWMG